MSKPTIFDAVFTAHHWERGGALFPSYTAFVQTDFDEYIAHDYTHAEVKPLDKLHRVLDHLLDTSADERKRAQGTNLRTTLNHWMREHQRQVTPHYDDTQRSYCVDDIAVLVKYKKSRRRLNVYLRAYTIGVLEDGTSYADNVSIETPDLPISWFEQYYPGAAERLKVGLALDLSNEELLRCLLTPMPSAGPTGLPETLSP